MRFRVVSTTVLLLLWSGLGAYLAQQHHAALATAEQDSRNLAFAFEENIRRTITAIDTTIRAARAARAHDPDHFDLVGWEQESGLTRELTLQLSLSGRNGDVIATNLGPITSGRISIANREHFRLTRDQPNDGLVISRPLIGRVSGRWSVQFVRKLIDASGAFDGVLVASLDPTFLSRFYTSLDVGRGALLLLGEDGVVRAVAPETVAKLASDLSGTPLITAASAAPHGTLRVTGTEDNIERIYSWRRIDPYGMTVAVGLATDDSLAGYRRDLRACGVIGLMMTLLTGLVSLVLARHRRDAVLSQEILQAAVENISQGLLVVDSRRRIPVLNARAVELLGLPPALQRPGIKFDDLLQWQLAAGEFAGQDDEAVRALVRSGGIERGTSVYQRTRVNGTVLEIRTKLLATGLAVRTFTDITAQQKAARVLADARDAAEAAARARSESLAIMSHEIRTPLNGVIGVAGLLEDMELGSAQREYVRLIRQSGDHLLELINDILDFSRLEADGVQLEEVDFDPAALIRNVVNMFLTQARGKGLHLSALAADTVPAMVSGDPGRLRQVLLNLISNAVKFTEQGWVSLTLTHEIGGTGGPAGTHASVSEGSIRLRFSVADSGIGIVPEAIERIFGEFAQMDRSISRRFGGSGLGLAISRRLIELMGGTITVESQPGVGSCFWFDVILPLAKAAPKVDMPAKCEPHDEAAASLRILLVEDNPTNRLVALRILERLGHQVDTACNGIEAIAAVALIRYDLVLMDVMMPEMDGITATREIRASETATAGTVIVGLTAGSNKENVAACLDAGMDAITTKPVTLTRLQQAILEGRVARRKLVPVPTARLQELAALLGESAAAEILHTFAEDTQTLLMTMRTAEASDQNRSVIYRSAHSIAGAARNVGAEALAKRASELEQTVGSLSTARVAAEIAALQLDFDVALAGMRTLNASYALPVEGVGSPISARLGAPHA